MAAASSSSLAVKGSQLLRTSQVKWAISGWAFFIAENAILSENRTFLIAELGNSNYYALYGTFSTAATASIGYAYYHLTRKGAASLSSPLMTLWSNKPPVGTLAASWALLTMGLIMASQAVPRLQLPVSSRGVRCPFDFSDRRDEDAALYGLERITRHPGLWSLAFVSAASSCLQSSVPLRLWFMGPTAVAWLGGMHTDSRFRRELGGHLDPYYDSMTSNLPFVAMLTGRQGAVGSAMQELASEIKPLNAGVAAAVATAWVLSRGRVRRV